METTRRRMSEMEDDMTENDRNRVLLVPPWPKFQSPLHMRKAFRIMNSLRWQGLLCDVVLVADGLEIAAHKLVLATCSPYFHAMFTGRICIKICFPGLLIVVIHSGINTRRKANTGGQRKQTDKEIITDKRHTISELYQEKESLVYGPVDAETPQSHKKARLFVLLIFPQT
uniref:BTB domain-containing protein n=1 Tax=Eptatretus burgeri TaxID=7764 RepID=A0A8C4N7K8_EPTBU